MIPHYIRQLACFTSTITFTTSVITHNSTCIVVYAVAQLVEALGYKPEGHGLDSRWCHWNFLLT